MLNYKKNAIKEASQLVNKVIDDAPKNEDTRYESRLIAFCLDQIGQEYEEVHYRPGADIQRLLDINGINHRQVSLQNIGLSNQFPLLIAYSNDTNTPLIIYEQSNQTYVYLPEDDRSELITNIDNIQDFGYEIYASMPSKVENIFKILNFTFRPELSAGFALIATSAIVMLFNLSIPIFTQLLVSRVLPNNDVQLLLEGLYIVMIVVIGSSLAQYLQLRMTLRLESVTDLRLQTALWDRVMKIPLHFINRYNASDLASRVNSITDLRQVLSNGVLSSLLSTIFSIFYFILMLTYDSKLTIFALVFTAVSIIGLAWLSIKNISLQMPLVETSAEITNFSYQTVEGMPQIRTNGVEPFILLRWLKEVSKYTRLQLKAAFYGNTMEMFSSLVQPLGSLLLFSAVAWTILNTNDPTQKSVIVISFISFNAAFNGFNATLSSASNILADSFGKAYVYWKRAEPVLYADTERGYNPESIQKDLNGSFKFMDVSYEFENSTQALFTDIDFEIRPGDYTAITGPSGCGKSTLLRILLGFIEPTGGEVFVDGIPLRQLAIRYYRKQLGVVIQNSRVTNGSIYDIVCGGLEYDESIVWDALEKAAIADDINDMPMKLDTVLAEGGMNLSGGQAQRLAIARALIGNPKVLIFDEATSALDAKSQEKITNVVNSMGITRISVAHRLSTIQQADHIIVLNNGITEQEGTWNEVSRSGFVKEMLERD